MLERILKQQQPLCPALLEIRKVELMPSDAEITAMKIFLDVMKPIVQITKVIGAEKWLMLSAVRPLLHKLTCKHLVSAPSDSRLKKTLKNAVLTNLKSRYTDPDVADLIDKACFLDPRFKTLSFLPESDRKRVIAAVEEEAKCFFVPTPESTEQEPPQKRKKKCGLMSLLEDIVCDSASTPAHDLQQVASTEIQIYLCIDCDPDQKSLLWWKDYHSQFPLLSKMTRKYLCIPATSVSSERAFSTGHIVNAKRACLLPENVNMLVFLAQNLD